MESEDGKLVRDVVVSVDAMLVLVFIATVGILCA
jgi:hypothetical protein